MTVLKILNFKLTDIDEGENKYTRIKKKDFSTFLKEAIQRKGENPILVYPETRYAHKKNKLWVQKWVMAVFRVNFR